MFPWVAKCSPLTVNYQEHEMKAYTTADKAENITQNNWLNIDITGIYPSKTQYMLPYCPFQDMTKEITIINFLLWRTTVFWVQFVELLSVKDAKYSKYNL